MSLEYGVDDAAIPAATRHNGLMHDKRRPMPLDGEDDPEFPMSDWRSEVADSNELRGYRDWVAKKRGISKTPYGYDLGRGVEDG